ncbi:TetR/AcrR family transcriptional regulator [Maridesulfovibrio salexigens]|uniref:Transcriptional regulator, TetR family n=1 Tax=Maridesulfovibrio salexigens (strain ATCC 14822 / DSM 2638 / NCIMB 8403 / VKM B-1763) TaxID=526222 RepID=C6BZV8_MARSD|nr:TetR/AcrR family transcriptional regulator [Maridesulfovibrio salexigens]ACS79015.1 transcriptional regulator, TetR family [Maridesulfovibrio salexigens DSM 2638]
MSDQSTKERILEAASRVFCEKGFKATTVRDICAEADANVAAINYHFGDKRKLYLQVLKSWMDAMLEDGDRLKGITEQSTIEERLRAYIYGELRSLCTYDDPEKIKKRKIRLLFEEYVSEACDPDLFKCHDDLDGELLNPIVRKMLAPIDDEKIIQQAHIAASGVLVHHFLAIIHYPEGEIESEEKLNFMTDYYTTFILGSLKAIKEKYHAE